MAARSSEAAPGTPVGWRVTAVISGVVALVALAGLVWSWQKVTGELGRSLTAGLDAPVRTTPVDVRMQLSAGQYQVFQRTDVPGAERLALTPEDVEVTAPDGRALTAVAAASPPNSIDADRGVFESVLDVDVPAAGVHRIRITGRDPAVPTEIMVVPSLGTSLEPVVRDGPARLLIGAGCLLVLLVSTVLLGVGLFRWAPPRAPAGPAPAPMTAPPGWYADPWAPGQVHYWDGHTWTGYRRPV